MIPLERKKTMQVQQALEEYLDAKRRNIKPKTLSESRRIIGYFCDFCREQSIQLEEIRPKVVDAYLDEFQATHHSKKGGPLSTHTVFQQVANIKIFLGWCAMDEELEQYIKLTTVQRIPNPKRAVLIKDVFTIEQIHALLFACESIDVGSEQMNVYLRDRNRAILLLLLDTGIRAAELCGLKMKHLFLSPTDPHIKVFGKGDKWREVGLGEKSRGELSRFVGKYRTKEKGSESFVFRTRRNAPLTEETLFRTIKQLGN
jgi:site-specific recombinase XerD